MTSGSIAIRSVQHWLYCLHRWGLMELDCAWAENYYVTKSDLLHRRVHEEGMYSSKDKQCYTAVTVYCDLPGLELYGVTDCLEVKNGVYSIVEYKPTKPKAEDYRHEDLMQVFAQKLCVDFVFGCDCEGYLYYADVKKRVRLPLSEHYNEYIAELKEILANIKEHITSGVIPPVKKGQYCNGCSMKDICMPKYSHKKGVCQTISTLLEGKL